MLPTASTFVAPAVITKVSPVPEHIRGQGTSMQDAGNWPKGRPEQNTLAELTSTRPFSNGCRLVGGGQQRCAAVECPQPLASVHVECRKFAVCKTHQQRAITAVVWVWTVDGGDGDTRQGTQSPVEKCRHGQGSASLTVVMPCSLPARPIPPTCHGSVMAGAHWAAEKVHPAALLCLRLQRRACLHSGLPLCSRLSRLPAEADSTRRAQEPWQASEVS